MNMRLIDADELIKSIEEQGEVFTVDTAEKVINLINNAKTHKGKPKKSKEPPYTPWVDFGFGGE